MSGAAAARYFQSGDGGGLCRENGYARAAEDVVSCWTYADIKAVIRRRLLREGGERVAALHWRGQLFKPQCGPARSRRRE